MTITVVIPTYRRPQDLKRCLEALKQQTRLADEVLVVVRDTDRETQAFLETYDNAPLPLRPATVTVTGVVAAMNVGLAAAQGEIVAYTDDDAAPCPDWLARMEAHFLQDTQVGGVGGRDFVYEDNQLKHHGAAATVGKVQWFGRLVGNHERGVGAAREVDVLKGVNMGFRRSAIQGLRFDDRMRGTGAQVHFELAFSFALKRAGWKLIYDPEVAVNHYHAKRFDEDGRGQFNHLAMLNKVHNETLVLLEYLSPAQRIAFLSWGVLVGRRGHPGVLQSLRFLPSEGLLSLQKLTAALQGRWEGWQTWRRTATLSSRDAIQQIQH